MTRYTNFARKRTYEQAGINYRDDNASSSTPPDTVASGGITSSSTPVQPTSVLPEKKRKKWLSEQSKNHDSTEQDQPHEKPPRSMATNANSQPLGGSQPETPASEDKSGKPARKTHRAGKRVKDEATRKRASEQRRLKRKEERTVDTICFACREKGHAARECTKYIEGQDDGDSGGRKQTGKKAVGLCYRCGSRKHNLSRCKETQDPSNPLPFASCFVCSGKGHLASSCPQNESKGIYPNGGCCKLCGENTHLAKDCHLRKKDAITSSAVLLGTGREAGADEDDFHALKRQTIELDKAEKKEQQKKRRVDVQVGAHSGTIRSFGKPLIPQAKKVVNF